MDVVRDEEPTASLVRPFLERGRLSAVPTHVEGDETGPLAAGVRAYAMTGGRSQAAIHLEFETMLRSTVSGTTSAPTQRFERGDILRMCADEVLSVAELSARLHLPIGVVRVVAADLLTEELMESFQPSENVADDVGLIQRLIAGVRSL